jgi:hypothetical protein
MTTTFIEFTDARKAMIAHTKGLLTNPANLKREVVNEYGYRPKKLTLRDFVVYAALRGSDYRKASHPAGYDNAKNELKTVLAKITNYTPEKQPASVKKDLARFVPEGMPLDELKASLEQALAI